MGLSLDRIVVWIIIGLIGGSLAGLIVKRERKGFGILRNFALGLAGALVGGYLFRLFALLPVLDQVMVSLRDVVAAVVGSLIVLAALWLWQRWRRSSIGRLRGSRGHREDCPACAKPHRSARRRRPRELLDPVGDLPLEFFDLDFVRDQPRIVRHVHRPPLPLAGAPSSARQKLCVKIIWHNQPRLRAISAKPSLRRGRGALSSQSGPIARPALRG